MFAINDTTRALTLTRGDTAVFRVEVRNEATGEAYALQAGDQMFFTVKRNARQSEVLLQKVVTAPGAPFHLQPEDTANWSYGEYVYDVQITTAGGDVYTVVPPAVLEIGEEVTWA